MGMSIIASLDNFLSINVLRIYVLERYGQFLSYRHPLVPSHSDKRGSTVQPISNCKLLASRATSYT